MVDLIRGESVAARSIATSHTIVTHFYHSCYRVNGKQTMDVCFCVQFREGFYDFTGRQLTKLFHRFFRFSQLLSQICNCGLQLFDASGHEFRCLFYTLLLGLEFFNAFACQTKFFFYRLV